MLDGWSIIIGGCIVTTFFGACDLYYHIKDKIKE